MKEKLKKLDWLKIVIALLLIIFWLIVGTCICKITTDAEGPGYDRIEDTVNQTVIEITAKVAEKYPICPELIQAVVFYESSNRMSARNGKCVGYMQVSEKWHFDRADRLGVSIHDGYGNILTGTDYLYELCVEYGDVALALMVYNGTSDAVKLAESGIITDYARKILELSEKLERLHGK